jgi:hemoglobin
MAYLLDRLGGDAALEAAVDQFYARVVVDPKLSHFFEGSDLAFLKSHQRKFMKIAFTKIPDTLDVPKFILDKHERLFAMGLEAEHFDLVAGHLIATFQALQVKQPLIDEAVAIVGPLRVAFEEGARKAKEAEAKKATLLSRLGGDAALSAAVEEFYGRLVLDEKLQKFFEGVNLAALKKHQEDFMRLAFTEIPADVDVPDIIYKKHYRLFARGLDGSHFDLVAGHFIATLQHLSVAQPLIDEAVGVIAPLRPIFEAGIKKE